MQSPSPHVHAFALRLVSLVAAAAFIYSAAFFFHKEGFSFIVAVSSLIGAALLARCFGTDAHFEFIFASGLFVLFTMAVVLGLFDGVLGLSARYAGPVRVSRDTAPILYWSLQGFWSLLALFLLFRASRAWANLRGRAVGA